METRLAAKGGRFQTLIEMIVTSPQFLNRRTPETPAGPVAQSGSEGRQNGARTVRSGLQPVSSGIQSRKGE